MVTKSVVEYQRAYKEIVDILSKNRNVISIFVMGSMVSGDLWEGSDIDLFVIYNDSFDEIRDVYLEVLNIPVHIKILSKELFIYYYNESGKRSIIIDSLIASKLIYSSDNEINDYYQKIIYMIDCDKARMNLVYLGDFFKEINICKKYISKGSIYTAYELLIRALNNFSMLYLSINGYKVSKESLSMACNFNDILNSKVENILYKEVRVEDIEELVEYMKGYLEDNIEKACKDLIDFIKQEDKEVSAYEIKINPYFKNFKIKIEKILSVLYEKNILSKKTRELKDSKGNFITLENVYKYNN